MQKFTDFVLQMLLPPNPVRNLDNSLTGGQQTASTSGTTASVDADSTTRQTPPVQRLPHDRPGEGFFGTNSAEARGPSPQNSKIPHLRNMYTKVGMFGPTTGGADSATRSAAWASCTTARSTR